jgi:hypothetical protein
MNWPSQNDAQFGSLVKPGKLNPGGLSSRIPHWIYPLDFLMSHKKISRVRYPAAFASSTKRNSDRVAKVVSMQNERRSTKRARRSRSI